MHLLIPLPRPDRSQSGFEREQSLFRRAGLSRARRKRRARHLRLLAMVFGRKKRKRCGVRASATG